MHLFFILMDNILFSLYIFYLIICYIKRVLAKGQQKYVKIIVID